MRNILTSFLKFFVWCPIIGIGPASIGYDITLNDFLEVACLGIALVIFLFVANWADS